jgi:phenylacetic acid degradation operon negative regulatory protein
MARQGWLAPVRLPEGPGYELTAKGAHRMDDAALRVYRSSDLEWNGEWHVVVSGRPATRPGRQRLRNQLAFLGYASVGESVFVAPRPHPDLDAVLASERVHAQRFTAVHSGPGSGPGSIDDLVKTAWDLAGLGEDYARWLEEAELLLAKDPVTDEEAFALRSRLVNEWRKFLFRDPGLPRALVPPGWPGIEAADYFAMESARLLPAAARHVDHCLAGGS